MQIREMTAADAAQMAAIEKTLFTDPWSEQGFLETLDRPEAHFIVLTETDGAVAGFCGAYCSAPEAEIVNVAVRQDMQGRGLGRQLVESLIARLRSLDCTDIILEVRKSNAPARALYTRCGFEILGERKHFYQNPDESAIIMQKLEEIHA